MDDHGSRENGRHKPDQYRSVHAQWMMPQNQMKDHHAHHTAQTIKLMAIIAERDSAMNERDLALSEKKTAQAERDMAIFQRDAAIADRNNAIMERDNAIAALEYARENSINGNAAHTGCTTPHGARNLSHHHHHHVPHSSSLDSSDSPYDHGREMHTSETLPSEGVKAANERRTRKEPKAEMTSPKKASKSRKNKRSNNGGEDLNRQVTVAEMHTDWRGQDINGGDDLKNQVSKKHRKEWKVEDLGGLNEVIFDESSMPVPVCSCTGRYQPCYKWGNGGWQSACCTTALSIYPLPVMPNKRHARVNGRKMSGTVFTKLLSRLASEGHDLRVPVDLKDHWSKHGTNRYITIK